MRICVRLVKNCGPELHLQVATKDFMGDLTHLTQPGNADGRVTRKVLQLVHAWGMAFKEVQILFIVILSRKCTDSPWSAFIWEILLQFSTLYKY